VEKKFNFVYITTNLINGKKYIGDHSSNDLNSAKTKNYIGSGRPYFKNAIKKYGKENFKREILEFFPSKQEAFGAQKKWIEKFGTLYPEGYNISPSGGNNCSGGISLEGRKNISDTHKNKKFSEEHKKHLSDSHRGIKQSMETVLKRTSKTTGLKRSDKTKEQMRKPKTPEHRENIRKSRLGKNHSEETREKMRKKHIFSEEGKKRWIASHIRIKEIF
jgi:group I intron endonuclease